MPNFEKTLDEALEPLMGKDEKSKPIKMEGAKKKSAEGVHRFDPPVEYAELEIDEEFTDKKPEQSKEARPDLPKKSSVDGKLDRPE